MVVNDFFKVFKDICILAHHWCTVLSNGYLNITWAHSSDAGHTIVLQAARAEVYHIS